MRMNMVPVGTAPPTFLIQPMDREVEEGAAVELECHGSGNPTPALFWSNGSKVKF